MVGVHRIPLGTVAARVSGKRVLVTGLSTVSSSTWVNPDGTFATDLSSVPVQAQVAAGVWQPLDETLSPSTYENLITWIGHDMRPATGNDYPHILLQGHGSPWTSAFLAFQKPAA